MNGSPIAPIAASLRLLKALSLARRGKMREAQAFLAAGGAPPENPAELQALAALVTKDGDYQRALRLWRLLLEREPGHAEARRMIDSIELWLSRPPWVRYIPAGIALLLLVVIVVVVAALSGGSTPLTTRAAKPPPTTPASLSPAEPKPASPPQPTITVPTKNKRRPGQ